MDKQKLQKAIDTLKDYNRWRRGNLKESPNATLVGESIDLLTNFLTSEMINRPTIYD